MKRFSVLSALLLSVVAMSGKDPLATGETAKVLWIGNSYTFYNDLPKMTANIAARNNITLENTEVLKGGERWSGHLQNPGLIEQLQKGGWDFIIMQEFSSGPAYSTKYVAENIIPYAETIDSIAHAYSPDAQTVLYMTWGHRNGNIRQTPYPLDDNYNDMQERIKTTYIDLAYDLNAWCAPVGIAWQNVRAKYPEIDLYTPDDFHPSLAGSWLAANAIFTTLYQKPYSTPGPDGLNATEAKNLQDIAEDAVFNNFKLLNIKNVKPFASVNPPLDSSKMIAHRGLWNAGYPQNSIEGMKAAFLSEATGLECDIRETKDGVLILNHDPDINGKTISETIYADLGSPETRPALLSDFIEVAANYPAKTVFAEIKSGDVKKIVKAFKDGGVNSNLIFKSFDKNLCKQAIKATKQPVYLLSSDSNLDFKKLKKEGFSGVSLMYVPGVTDAELIDTIHNAGLKAAFWTINDPNVADSLIKNNADFIISDLNF